MAHILKLQNGNTTRVIGHCFRQTDKSGFLKYHTNSNIDPSKSKPNIYTGKTDDGIYTNISYSQAVKNLSKRIDDVGLNRKNQVVLCDWVFTVPVAYNLNQEQEKQLLFAFIDFVAERYGEDNLIYATMHFDETTPHVHVGFTPVKDGRFNCRELINRKELRVFHSELAEYMSNYEFKDFTVDPKDICSGEKGSSLTVDELKAETHKQNQAVEVPTGKQKSSGKVVLDSQEYSKLQDDVKSLKSENEALHERYRVLADRYDDLHLKHGILKAEHDTLKHEKDILTAKTEPERYATCDVNKAMEFSPHPSGNELTVQIDPVDEIKVTFDLWERVGEIFRVYIDKFKQYTCRSKDGEEPATGDQVANRLQHWLNRVDPPLTKAQEKALEEKWAKQRAEEREREKQAQKERAARQPKKVKEKDRGWEI